MTEDPEHKLFYSVRPTRKHSCQAKMSCYAQAAHYWLFAEGTGANGTSVSRSCEDHFYTKEQCIEYGIKEITLDEYEVYSIHDT